MLSTVYFNVSTWNPTEYFSRTYLWKQIHLVPFNYIPYLYSYEIDSTLLRTTRKNLGGSDKFGCLICNTGTSAISLVTSVLKAIGIKRVLIICPVYYSVLYNFLQRGIQIIKIYLQNIRDGYCLPQSQIIEMLDSIDAIWITNPIYNTSVYWKKEDIDFFKFKIPSRILIICDDCYAASEHELIQNFGNNSNYISIHDPLKQILVNGLKFAGILYPFKYEHDFEHWSDIICGSLSYSTVQSLEFFNSANFKKICSQLQQHFYDANKRLQQLLQHFPTLFMDSNSSCSHMRMCFAPNLPHDYLQDKEKMFLFMVETGTSLIPGNRFHFPNNNGFSFRINLGRDCDEFWDALIHIFKFLSSNL